MTDGDPRLVALVELWREACDDFVALAREIPEDQWHTPTDLLGWDVKDNVAHTAHLEAVLAGAPEETVEVAEAPHLVGLQNYYTEQGVLARKDVDMATLVEEIVTSVAQRYAELQASPPADGQAPPARTPGGIGWNTQTLLSNRPLDVWMHEQDVRRAIGRPGGLDSPVAHHVVGIFGRSLPMVLGKRVAPPAGTTVRVVVEGREFGATVGPDGRGARAEADAEADAVVRLSVEDYVVLCGGRRGVEDTSPVFEGDEDLGRRVLAALAVTP